MTTSRKVMMILERTNEDERPGQSRARIVQRVGILQPGKSRTSDETSDL